MALHDLGLPASSPVCGLAADDEIWLANNGPHQVKVAIAVPRPYSVAILDESAFTSAAANPAIWTRLRDQIGPLTLDAYAVARIVIGD